MRLRRRRPAIVFTDRYSVLGPPNGCQGPCEGTGYVPVRLDGPRNLRGDDERDAALIALWHAAESTSPTDDGYHFVPCPDCNPNAAEYFRGR